ncbi:MAG: YqgE/AlgH family protein [Chitinophagaceae bacterium]|nr:YqgE/AlgH family protein [Chitinophagaceae bacterium]
MIEPGSGILLIADPFLKDPNFLRTVVLLCEHNEEGSFGFVINRPYGSTLAQLIPEMEGFSLPVFYGGPVQADTIHFVHQYPDEIPGGQEIMDGIYWGGDFNKAMQLVKSGRADSLKIRFFIGYSGWGEGQLEEEMKEKSWLTAAATKRLVFTDNINNTWKDALKHLGGDYEMMINFPIDPQLN